jgi:hypothetical protein
MGRHTRVRQSRKLNFGKRLRTVDGAVSAQPLYIPFLVLPGKRNLISRRTEHDSYAFDVNGAYDTPLWKSSFIDRKGGIGTWCRPWDGTSG